MLTEREIELMEHALGLPHSWDTHGYHYKRHGKQYIKSYRNYFQTQVGDVNYDIWCKLLQKNMANSWINTNNGECYSYFEVSKHGWETLQKERGYIIKWV